MDIKHLIYVLNYTAIYINIFYINRNNISLNNKDGGITIKSSTYASLVTVIFIKHKNKIATSVDSVIKTTDQLCMELKLENDLSHMTKYRIISDMLKNRILSTRKTSRNRKLRLSKNIIDVL